MMVFSRGDVGGRDVDRGAAQAVEPDGDASHSFGVFVGHSLEPTQGASGDHHPLAAHYSRGSDFHGRVGIADHEDEAFHFLVGDSCRRRRARRFQQGTYGSHPHKCGNVLRQSLHEDDPRNQHHFHMFLAVAPLPQFRTRRDVGGESGFSQRRGSGSFPVGVGEGHIPMFRVRFAVASPIGWRQVRHRKSVFSLHDVRSAYAVDPFLDGLSGRAFVGVRKSAYCAMSCKVR